MANPQHLEILKQGVQVWNQWRQDNRRFSPDLREAPLTGATLEGANLTGVHFNKANLSAATLTGVLLEGANLKGATLTGANLRGANLTAATLTGATLAGANLTLATLTLASLEGATPTGANLTVANLTGANLVGATLKNTNINRANFKYVRIGNTIFADMDLSQTKELETVQHHRPSTLGMDTLRQSGNLPLIFLRGCGLDETFINYLPSLINQPIEFYSCSISYSHDDKDFAHQLYDFLQGKGIRCWLDAHQVSMGAEIMEEIDRGIKLWDKMLLCASEYSLTSWWVDEELDRAFSREERLMKGRKGKVWSFIALDLDGFLLEGWKNGKAEEVRSRLAADFTGWESDDAKMQAQFEQVLRALRTDGGQENPPPSLL